MAHCPHCGHDLSTTDAVGDPHRLADGFERADGDWVPVARITNLAEAGFLEDLLQDRQIPSRVRQWDDFSAVDGSWSTVYIMQVPAEHARSAAAAMEDWLAYPEPSLAASHDLETARYGEESLDSARTTANGAGHGTRLDDSGGVTSERGHGTLRWVVPLLAGAAAFSAGYVAKQPDKRPAKPSLRHTVRKVETDGNRLPRSHALGQKARDDTTGPPRPESDSRQRATERSAQFRFRRDTDSEQLVVEEDRDGDGVFERRRFFRRSDLDPLPDGK